MTTTLEPVRPEQRIESLDLIRGLAVLGILAVNAGAFAMPYQVYADPSLSPFPLEGASAEAWRVMHVFFEQKFISLFSMLFGVSIFLVGGERGDLARGALLRRRLLWLAVFGVIHGAALWYGDILLLYAWAGVWVMLARSWSPRRLLVTGGLLYGGFAALMALAAAATAQAPAEAMAGMEAEFSPQAVQASIAAYQSGLVGALRENLTVWVTGELIGALLGVFPVIGMMMAGLALFRLGVLAGRAPTWVYAAFVVAAAASLALIWREAEAALRDGFGPIPGLGGPANGLLAPIVALGYASGLVLLARAGAGRLLGPLKAVGRMAFTNYIAQTLIMTTIFYGGRGLGLMGELDRPAVWLIVVGVWVAQLVWSPLWLARFRLGPLEWLWRRLAYGQGLRREVAAAG